MAAVNNNRPLTLARLREVLDYDQVTGLFVWRETISPRATVGSIAGMIRKHGYRMIVIDGGQYKAARLAWFYVHGEWPVGCLDHANGIKADDRMTNLRKATLADNSANMLARSNTGVKGVHKNKNGAYQASIMRHGKNLYLGVYKKLDEAAAVRRMAALKLHGNFAGELR